MFYSLRLLIYRREASACSQVTIPNRLTVACSDIFSADNKLMSTYTNLTSVYSSLAFSLGNLMSVQAHKSDVQCFII